MSFIKNIFVWAVLSVIPFTLQAKEYRIGVSMALFEDPFMTVLRNAIRDEMSRENVKGQIEDAKSDVSTQLQQVQEFIGQGVDAIILNPVDTEAVKPVIAQAKSAGIPLIFVNRRPQIPLDDKMVYVGSDSLISGELQMEALAKIMNGRGNVAILMGDLANEATRERTKGVESVIAKYPDMKVVQKQSAKFSRNEAVDVVSNWMGAGDEIDAIVANNDEMAIGALIALGKNKNVLVAGIDGTRDALRQVEAGKMVVSVFQDARGQGEGAVKAAVKLLNGEPVEKQVMIPYQLITKDNYKNFVGKS